MIYPFLRGIFKWDKAPVSWAICVCCLLFFLMTLGLESFFEAKMKIIIEKPDFLTLTGRLYEQFQAQESKAIDPELKNKYQILANQALRDQNFLEKGPLVESYFGDKIAISHWKKDVSEFFKYSNRRASVVFGLSHFKLTAWQWVTYQFMHGSFIHLMGNMIVFLIFGGFIEVLLGGEILIFIFLSGGFIAALSYLTLNSNNIVPLIGASGSVSALIGFYAFFEQRERIRFFYFVSPFKNFFGFIYLPTPTIFLFCVLPDIAAWIATPNYLLSGVAYSAHIFGALWGAILGLSLRFLLRSEAST